jgi:cytochrome c
MGDLFWNKVFGAILAVVLGVMALQQISATVFASGAEGGHHGEEEGGTLNDWAHSRFAYYTDIAETSAAGGEEEEAYDLGALLAAASVDNGERTFKAKCSTCHTIAEGGSNGTGPNLHGILEETHAHRSDFGYSSAMQATAGTPWTYSSIDSWLENPSSYIRGTTMAFAGLRRDDERADVIAYLAANTPNAAAFPEPLAADEGTEGGSDEGEEASAEGEATEGEAVETSLDAETVEDAPTQATGEIDTVDSVDDTDQANGNEGEVELAPEATTPETDAEAPAETDETEE